MAEKITTLNLQLTDHEVGLKEVARLLTTGENAVIKDPGNTGGGAPGGAWRQGICINHYNYSRNKRKD